ncbi:MAG: diguanylate cyclase [Spirochaetes bacterium]|nr:diguanylate cyclase [Spirochaetota bacterium]
MYSILHLETSSLYRKILSDISEELNCKYIAVDSCEEALKIVATENIDLILTAMELEDGNSISFIKKINESESTSIPIVVFTGNDSAEDRRIMFDLGIIDYISKKSTPEEIKKSIIAYKSEDEISQKLDKLKIAVCDDSSMDRFILERIFKMYSIKTADFYESGEELFTSGKEYDIYIVDLILRKMSGKSIIMKLRSSGSESVIITISGIDHFKTVSNVLMIGADDYITKPFNNELFMARLKTNVRSYLLVKQLERQSEELKKMSVTDGLTQVYNHKFILERLDQEIHKTRRHAHKLSIIMFDIDHFKSVNDTYGHQFGDVILRKVAEILMNSVRDIDIVGRYGGEEFLVILPESSSEEAMVVAERIRLRVLKVKSNKTEFSLSISGGLVEFDNHTSATFVKDADMLLYKAKQNGRNRIEIM